MRLFSKNHTDSIGEAKHLYTKGHYKKALKACRNLLGNKEYDFEAQNLLGDIYYKMGNKSKALDVYRTLGDKLETDKFTERAIAIIRKIIRFYPDQFDLYRKLSKLYHKKGLEADKISVLYELSDIYNKRGDKDKAIDTLKEIADVDNNNAENYYKIIQKFYNYKRFEEVCRYIYYAAKLAYEKDNQNILNKVIDTALEAECDLTGMIKYTAGYFSENPKQKDTFKKYAKKYLLENFDNEFFINYAEFISYDEDRDFYHQLKDKYKNINIYYHILKNMISNKDYENIPYLIDEIIDMPEYNFDSTIINAVKDHFYNIDDLDVLDSISTLAEKCNMKDVTINIYTHMKDLHEKTGNNDKVQALSQFIEELQEKNTAEETIEGTHEGIDSEYEENDELNFSDMDDLIEHTSLESEDQDSDPLESLDLNIEDNNEDTDIFNMDFGSETDEESDDELSQDQDQGDETKKENDEEMDIELDLNDLSSENEQKEDKDLDTEESESLDDISFNDTSDDFGDDFELEIPDDFESLDLEEIDEESVFKEETETGGEDSKDSSIAEIKKLAEEGDTEQANKKLESLITRYPDDKEVKDLASRIIFDDKPEVDAADETAKTGSDSVTSEFQHIANAIRESINNYIDPEDYETHYDMAMAYMEMELFDDALMELKKSATSNKRYESLFLMAECNKRMGTYEEAVNIHKLIVVDYPDSEKMLNSLYEIASIYELQNDYSAAQSYYKKIYFLDKNFRDVDEKIDSNTPFANSDEELDTAFEQSYNNPEVPEKSKKKKISYL